MGRLLFHFSANLHSVLRPLEGSSSRSQGFTEQISGFIFCSLVME